MSIEPHAPGVDRRIWWGASSCETAEWTARQSLNLMSSTRLTEATGEGFSRLQAGQIRRYRETWKEAGHDWTPRVSVSRSMFLIVSDVDRKFFALLGEDSRDQIGFDYNLHVLQAFAEHTAPAPGWLLGTDGSVTGYAPED